MANPVVRVVIAATDATRAAFDGVRARIAGFAKSSTSLLTGIGIGLTAEKITKFFKDSLKAAAEADTGFKKNLDAISGSFRAAQERVGGAILGNRGIVNAITRMVGYLTDLLVPTVEIVMKAFTGWELIFAGASRAIGAFVNGAKSAWGSLLQTIGEAGVQGGNLLGLFGLDVGTGGAERLANMGARLQQDAIRGNAASRDQFDARVQDILAGSRGSARTGQRPGSGRAGASAGGGLDLDALNAAGTDAVLRAGARNRRFDQPGVGVGRAQMVTGLLPDLETSLDAIEASLQDLNVELPDFIRDAEVWETARDAMAEQIADALGGGIAAGFDTLFATGSIGAGFAEMTSQLLTGIGSAAQQFGVQSLKIATLMETIKKGLASFLPGGAIAASVAMIALGSALKAAGRAFSGGGNQARSGFSGGGSERFAAGAEAGGGTREREFIFEVPPEALIQAGNKDWLAFLSESLSRATGERVIVRAV